MEVASSRYFLRRVTEYLLCFRECLQHDLLIIICCFYYHWTGSHWTRITMSGMVLESRLGDGSWNHDFQQIHLTDIRPRFHLHGAWGTTNLVVETCIIDAFPHSHHSTPCQESWTPVIPLAHVQQQTGLSSSFSTTLMSDTIQCPPVKTQTLSAHL